MKPLAIGFLFALVSTALTSSTPAIDPTARRAQEPEFSAAQEDPALGEVRELLETARRSQAAKDHAGARERIVEAIERAFRADRGSPGLFEELGQFAHDAGELAAAERARREVLEVRSRTLPQDHPELQRARLNLAATIVQLGDLQGARSLEEEVVEVRARTLPADHPDLQIARQNLAATMYELGDLHGARALQEAALAVQSRILPEDHPDLQRTKGELGRTMHALGDLARARDLQEAVLAIFERTLPEDHPDLLAARTSLASTLEALGNLQGALELERAVLAARARTLPLDHVDLQIARMNLGTTMHALGDVRGARALFEAVIEVLERTLQPEHPQLQEARELLAAAMADLGDLHGARALFEGVLGTRARTLPDGHPDVLHVRVNLAETIAKQLAGAKQGAPRRETEKERCADLVVTIARSLVRAAREALLTRSAREAEEICAALAERLATTLSFAEGYGVFEPLEELESESFVLSETTRGAALASAAIARRTAGAPDYVFLRGELREASVALAALAQEGSTSEEFQLARMRREEAERELVALGRELLGGDLAGLDFDVDALGKRLGQRDAVVGFRRYTRRFIEANVPSDVAKEEASEAKSVESLCAFVVRPGGAESASASADPSLEIVQLGAIDAIDEVVRAWREAIGAGIERGVGASGVAASEASTRGEELRRLVWDPLVAELGDAERVIVALDDTLHLVPLEALPLDAVDGDTGGKQLVGDRWRIETRITLSELLGERPASDPSGLLVALGGASFDSEPVELAEDDQAAPEEDDSRKNKVAGILRGGAGERSFAPLTYTGLEAREIAALHDEVFAGESAALVLEKRKASRAAMEELAPRARFLHVATHGWFAPESIRSRSDVDSFDVQSRLAVRLSREEQVRGMSPMVLCGLALAGANLSMNAPGSMPGLVTAEELSTLDLSNCELAVLSAGDTNVGVRRAGQGVASLQKALHMAGARSVITSLWKVPDEATKELMVDFYRRIWVEKKPKAQGLWEAKQRMREAKDVRGKPLYTTRDWAAWVLTGEPF